MIRHCFVILMAMAINPILHAQDPDIRQLMTPEELAASGLEKLSNSEIETINNWLIRYTVEDAEEMLESNPVVQEADNEDIVSRIDGAFNGWNGPTRFRLQNGQVWETNSMRTYSYSAVDPEVTISRNWMGVYRMRIVETGRAINVRRVQ